MNNIIEIECKCGKTLKINIKTISKLKNRIDSLEKENKDLRAKIAALETIMKRYENKDDVNSLFNDLFGGK